MSSDTLKPFDEVCEPDPRQAAFLRVDLRTSSSHPKNLQDHYSDVSMLVLPDYVPEDIRIHFDTSRNLLLYSWFVWRFAWVAQLYAYASLEMALRYRALREDLADPKEPPGLAGLLKIALDQRWIIVEELPEYIELDRNQKAALDMWLHVYPERELALNWAPQVDPAKHTAMMAKSIPFFRNELAHGTSYLSGNPGATLLRCRDIIAQLLRPGPEASERPPYA